MHVWIVSLEWNQAPSEVTGDTGIVGVFTNEAAAKACQQAERVSLDDGGEEVYQFSMAAGRFCDLCGEEPEQLATGGHDCPNRDGDPAFCDQCGAELTQNGTCDNDHDAWTIDIHCTEHEVKGIPLERISS